MTQFNPCRGGDYCTRSGERCEGCGRTMEEIERTKLLVGDLVGFAREMGYENADEFFRFVADKAAAKAAN